MVRQGLYSVYQWLLFDYDTCLLVRQRRRVLERFPVERVGVMGSERIVRSEVETEKQAVAKIKSSDYSTLTAWADPR